jgi:uncharacterized protein
MTGQGPEDIFQGAPGAYRQEMTGDGHWTLWSERYQEHCHSRVGALKECYHVYIHGAELPEKIQHLERLLILEIGFGIALNYLATCQFLAQQAPTLQLYYLAIEQDRDLLAWCQQQDTVYPSGFPTPRDLWWSTHHSLDWASSSANNKELAILLGDARQTLPRAQEQNFLPAFNIIYQDPFSYKHNCELWTVEWFSLLRTLCAPDVRLSTYSCSTPARLAMRRAGFNLESFPGLGAKRFCTRALLDRPGDPILHERLKNSPSLPFQDLAIPLPSR